MKQLKLCRAIPNEQFQLVVEFSNAEFRLLDLMLLVRNLGWTQLAYPQHGKNFCLQRESISWPAGGEIDINFIYENSRPLAQTELERQILRLSYKNQAPSSEDASHHVYSVYLAPFHSQMFHLAVSIGGGHAERGGGWRFSLAGLLAWPDWRQHMKLAGCVWAIDKIDAMASQTDLLLASLISEACLRNGQPET